jgi:hypothetical protein
MRGASKIPHKEMTKRTMHKTYKRFLARLKNSFLECVVWYSVRTGTKAALAAPSPIRSLRRLGILKDTTKAWANKAVPKKFAISMSLAKPRTLLTEIAKLIKPVDLSNLLFDKTPPL